MIFGFASMIFYLQGNVADFLLFVAVQQETCKGHRFIDIKQIGGEYTCFSCTVSEKYNKSRQGEFFNLILLYLLRALHC